MASENYLGNPNLKNVGQKIKWTEKTLTEYMKCKENPEYFIQNFVKIIHVDKGLVPFEMYDYQKDMIHKFTDNRFSWIITCTFFWRCRRAATSWGRYLL